MTVSRAKYQESRLNPCSFEIWFSDPIAIGSLANMSVSSIKNQESRLNPGSFKICCFGVIIDNEPGLLSPFGGGRVRFERSQGEDFENQVSGMNSGTLKFVLKDLNY